MQGAYDVVEGAYDVVEGAYDVVEFFLSIACYLGACDAFYFFSFDRALYTIACAAMHEKKIIGL